MDNLHIRRLNSRKSLIGSPNQSGLHIREPGRNFGAYWNHDGPIEMAYLDTSRNKRRDTIFQHVKHVPILHRTEEMLKPTRPLSTPTLEHHQKMKILSSKRLVESCCRQISC